MHEARAWVKEMRFFWMSPAELTCHWCGAGGGEIEAGDFFVAVLLDTDELSLIYDTRLQAWDGVGVPVARDGGFLPLPAWVFLQEKGCSDSERLPRLQAGESSDLTPAVWLLINVIFKHRYDLNGFKIKSKEMRKVCQEAGLLALSY